MMQDIPEFEALEDQKQQRGIVNLLTEPTIQAAARATGVHESTIYRWLRQPDFAEAYRSTRRESLRQSTAQLQRLSGEAVQVMADVMNDLKASPRTRITAAKWLLELAYRSDDYDELIDLLDDLRDELKAGYERR